MGRITDLIPSLYYGDDNDLVRFTEALDVEVDLLEKQVRGITDLINIDKCPADKLPYLAALINCPLIGDDPIFWRRQIRNWPYILKLKGTERSLELVLDSIGAASWDIKTFFRDAGGGYVTSKPEGKPFKDNSGLWHNIRTHYFGIEATLSKDFVEAQNFTWDMEDVKEKLRLWFEHGKPYHAELLKMVILPPKFLPDDHICKWDFCNWEHIELISKFWRDLTPNSQLDFSASLIHAYERGIFTVSDSLWDISAWDEQPRRILEFGAFTESGFVASLEWGEGDAAMLSPNLWDFSKWDYVSTYSRIVGCEFERFIPVVEWDEQVQDFGAFIYGDFICDMRPRWDAQDWTEHYNWVEHVRQEEISPESTRAITGTLDWNDKREYPASSWDVHSWDNVEHPQPYDAPLPKWSERKIWRKSKSWDITTELSAAWQIDFQEEL